MEPCPSDRKLSAKRLSDLSSERKKGRLRVPEWASAFCAETNMEYRVNGKLYMLKVTPPHGVPYYLIDEKGDGRMSRQDPLDSGLRVPMWVIRTF